MLDQRRRRLLAAFAIAVTCILWFRPLSWSFKRGDPDSRDFAPVIAGAHCLFSPCDPYDSEFDESFFHALTGRGVFMVPEVPVYPPSTFVIVSPLLVLPWSAMHVVWTLLGAGLLLAAFIFLILRFELYTSVIAYAPIFFLLQSGFIFPTLWVGQPAMVAVPAAAIALVLLVSGSAPALATVLLTLSLCLKPQIALAPAAYLLLHRPARRSVLTAFAITGAVFLLGTGLLYSHLHSTAFFAHESANIRLSLEPGRLSDPSPANYLSTDFVNLQPPLARFIANVHANNLVTYTVAGLLFAALVIIWVKNPAARTQRYTIIAALVLISLLPVYHRSYDRLLLLAIIPGLWELRQQRREFYWSLTALAGLWIFNRRLANYISAHVGLFPYTGIIGVAMCLVVLASLLPQREPARLVSRPDAS